MSQILEGAALANIPANSATGALRCVPGFIESMGQV
jgi:hypothetical protein